MTSTKKRITAVLTAGILTTALAIPATAAEAPDGADSASGGGMERQTVQRDAVPFDMSKCTLTLWAISEEE